VNVASRLMEWREAGMALALSDDLAPSARMRVEVRLGVLTDEGRAIRGARARFPSGSGETIQAGSTIQAARFVRPPLPN